MKEITETLIENGQEHILEHLDLMTVEQKDALINDLKQVDFKLLESLFETYKKLPVSKNEKKVFSAAEVLSFDEGDASVKERKRLYEIGEDYLSQGKIAVFLVAGGQGTRLGFDGPKGCYLISPVKGKSLFQLFSENLPINLRCLSMSHFRNSNIYQKKEKNNSLKNLYLVIPSNRAL